MTDRYQAYVSPAGRLWMLECHRQPDVRAVVVSDLVHHIKMIRVEGPEYGVTSGRPIRKLRTYDNVWETRVRHPIGQFRQFFRFTHIDECPAVVFIDGELKKGANLPKHILDRAERRLDLFVTELLSDPSLQDRCRIQ